MKIKRLIFLLVMIEIFCITISNANAKTEDVYVNEDNDALTTIVLKYGQSAFTTAHGGVFPYTYYGSDCVDLVPTGDDVTATYTARDEEAICNATLMDTNFWSGIIEFRVCACECRAGTPWTSGAMSADGTSFTTVVCSADEPDDDNMC